jgi:hypothetical protein
MLEGVSHMFPKQPETKKEVKPPLESGSPLFLRPETGVRIEPKDIINQKFEELFPLVADKVVYLISEIFAGLQKLAQANRRWANRKIEEKLIADISDCINLLQEVESNDENIKKILARILEEKEIFPSRRFSLGMAKLEAYLHEHIENENLLAYLGHVESLNKALWLAREKKCQQYKKEEAILEQKIKSKTLNGYAEICVSNILHEVRTFKYHQPAKIKLATQILRETNKIITAIDQPDQRKLEKYQGELQDYKRLACSTELTGRFSTAKKIGGTMLALAGVAGIVCSLILVPLSIITLPLIAIILISMASPLSLIAGGKLMAKTKRQRLSLAMNDLAEFSEKRPPAIPKSSVFFPAMPTPKEPVSPLVLPETQTRILSPRG